MTSQNPTTDDTVTSQKGHCEHCHEMCQVHEPDTPPQTSEHAGLHSGWLGGYCPACAERERIVEALRARAAKLHPAQKPWKPGDAIAFAAMELDVAAVVIERGEHLEEK